MADLKRICYARKTPSDEWQSDRFIWTTSSCEVVQ